MLKETILEVYFDFPRHGVHRIHSEQTNTIQGVVLESEYRVPTNML